MTVSTDWWFPAWNIAVRDALRHGRDDELGSVEAPGFDAVFNTISTLWEGRDEIGPVIDRWDGLRIVGERLSFSRPFTITEAEEDGKSGPVVAEVFGRFHDDLESRGGCLLVRAADWMAFVATEDDRVAVLLRSGSRDELRRVTLTHEVHINPSVNAPTGELMTCGILEGGRNGPVVLTYERRRPPRWIGLDGTGRGCSVDLRQVPPFRETAKLLGDIVRGQRPARDFFRAGMPLFGGDVPGTLADTGDRRALLCLALVMRTMVWKYESSG